MHPETLSKVPLSHPFPTASAPISIHDTVPIQNRRQRAHSGSSVLSWLQIRLCVITLFGYGKHMTMNCSTIGLCAYLQMWVCDYGYLCMCVHSGSVIGCMIRIPEEGRKKGHSCYENNSLWTYHWAHSLYKISVDKKHLFTYQQKLSCQWWTGICTEWGTLCFALCLVFLGVCVW